MHGHGAKRLSAERRQQGGGSVASGVEYPPTPVGLAEGVGGTAARSRLKAAQLNDCALPATEWVPLKTWPADFDIWRLNDLR